MTKRGQGLEVNRGFLHAESWYDERMVGGSQKS